jgi:hypothetical protein
MEINEEVKQKMIEYLQSFEAGIKKAGEFSAEQAPLVVQEFLRWEIVCNGAFAVAAGMLLIVFLAAAIRYHFKVDGEEKVFVWLVASVPLVAFGIGFGTCAERAGKAWLAPRIVVLEKISTLVQ